MALKVQVETQCKIHLPALFYNGNQPVSDFNNCSSNQPRDLRRFLSLLFLKLSEYYSAMYFTKRVTI